MTASGEFFGKKVVITGASGFIGSRLARELVEQGASVTAFSRRDSDLWRLQHDVADIDWAYPDFSDFEALDAELQKVQPDFIYHLATYYSVDNDVDLSGIIDTNIKAGAFLVKAAGRIDNLKLFINTGTCAEYGDVRDDATEETKAAPPTIYAATKAAAGMIIDQMAADLKVPLTTLVLYNLYGEYEAARRIIPYIILSLLAGKELELTGCEQAKDYSYIGDFTRAFRQAAIHCEQAAGKHFNIGSGRTIKMKELVDEIAALFPGGAEKIRFGALPYRDNEMWHQSTSIEQARKHLDWRPQTSLQEGIKKTVDWYKQNRHLYHG